MKKLMAMALVASMTVTLVACGGKNSSSADTSADAQAGAPAAEGSADAAEETAAPAADAVKLNLSVPDAESSSIAVAAKEFAKQLNEKSEGRLDVTVYCDGSLYGGDATAAVTTMQDGGLDMLCLATSWYASFDDSFNVIQIPYLFDSVDEEQAYLNDERSEERRVGKECRL